jgi:hypothetical protein
MTHKFAWQPEDIQWVDEKAPNGQQEKQPAQDTVMTRLKKLKESQNRNTEGSK